MLGRQIAAGRLNAVALVKYLARICTGRDVCEANHIIPQRNSCNVCKAVCRIHITHKVEHSHNVLISLSRRALRLRRGTALLDLESTPRHPPVQQQRR